MPGPRVVVIEDEPAIRRGVVDALQATGYQVTEAADGVRGLEEAVRQGVDLILLDLLLPKCDGLEILAEVRKVRPTLPVKRRKLPASTKPSSFLDRPSARTFANSTPG